MIEGYSFLFSILSPIVAFFASVCSLITMIGSIIDLGRAEFRHTVDLRVRLAAFLLTGLGIISQSIGWISGYFPVQPTFMNLPLYYPEGSLGFSVVFLIMSIINQKRRYSY